VNRKAAAPPQAGLEWRKLLRQFPIEQLEHLFQVNEVWQLVRAQAAQDCAVADQAGRYTGEQHLAAIGE
jgi:hypothetical protein